MQVGRFLKFDHDNTERSFFMLNIPFNPIEGYFWGLNLRSDGILNNKTSLK